MKSKLTRLVENIFAKENKLFLAFSTERAFYINVTIKFYTTLNGNSK